MVQAHLEREHLHLLIPHQEQLAVALHSALRCRARAQGRRQLSGEDARQGEMLSAGWGTWVMNGRLPSAKCVGSQHGLAHALWRFDRACSCFRQCLAHTGEGLKCIC